MKKKPTATFRVPDELWDKFQEFCLMHGIGSSEGAYYIVTGYYKCACVLNHRNKLVMSKDVEFPWDYDTNANVAVYAKREHMNGKLQVLPQYKELYIRKAFDGVLG